MSFLYIQAGNLNKALSEINKLKVGSFDYLSFEVINGSLTLTTFSSQKNRQRIWEAKEIIKIENIDLLDYSDTNFKFCVFFDFIKNLSTITRKGEINFRVENEFVKINLWRQMGCETESVHTISNFFVRESFGDKHFVFSLNLKDISQKEITATEVWNLTKDLKMETENESKEEIYEFQEIPELKNWHLEKQKAQKTLLKLAKEKYENLLKNYKDTLAQLIMLDQERIEAKTQTKAKFGNRIKEIRELSEYSDKDKNWETKSKLNDDINKILEKHLKFKKLFPSYTENRSGVHLNSDIPTILNEIEALFKDFLKSNSVVQNQIILRPQTGFVLIDYVQPAKKEIKTPNTRLLTGKIKIRKQRTKKIQPKTIIEVKPKKVLSKIDNLVYQSKKTVIELPKNKETKWVENKIIEILKTKAKMNFEEFNFYFTQNFILKNFDFLAKIKFELNLKETANTFDIYQKLQTKNPNQMYFVFDNVILFKNILIKLPKQSQPKPQINQIYKQCFSLFLIMFLNLNLMDFLFKFLTRQL